MGQFLASSIKDFIESAGCKIQDVEKIICGVGPGSYTGTRVGVAFAESLAFGLDINLIKVPSLLFYIKESESSILIASNFNTYGYLEINQDTYSYSLIHKDNLKSSPRILEAKTIYPSPFWPLIDKVSSQASEDALLYFSLS